MDPNFRPPSRPHGTFPPSLPPPPPPAPLAEVSLGSCSSKGRPSSPWPLLPRAWRSCGAACHRTTAQPEFPPGGSRRSQKKNAPHATDEYDICGLVLLLVGFSRFVFVSQAGCVAYVCLLSPEGPFQVDCFWENFARGEHELTKVFH